MSETALKEAFDSKTRSDSGGAEARDTNATAKNSPNSREYPMMSQSVDMSTAHYAQRQMNIKGRLQTNWRKQQSKSRPKGKNVTSTGNEPSQLGNRSKLDENACRGTSPDGEVVNSSAGRPIGSSGGNNAQIQINNPIQIYHVYFTQQSQRASMDLKKKLQP